MAIILFMVIMFTIVETNTKPEQNWDVSCPMANANIGWQQTFYGGLMEVEQ